MSVHRYLTNEELKDEPVSSRKCTDLFFCCIFTLFVLATVLIGIIGFYNGEPDLLLYPYDSSGNQCGRPSHPAADYHYLYYPAAAVLSNFSDYRVCVKSCPAEISSYMICYENEQIKCDELSPVIYLKHLKMNIDLYQSKSIFKRFCVPKSSSGFFSKIIDTVYNSGAVSWVSDILRCWGVIFIVFSTACVLSYIYLMLIRFCAELIIWASVILTGGIIVIFGLFLNSMADRNYSEESQKISYKALVIASVLMYCSIILYILIILFLYKRINLAVALMKSTALFIHDATSVLLIPFFLYLAYCAVFVFWILALIFLYSSGELEKTTSAIARVSWDHSTRNAFYFELISIIWLNSFKIALSQLIVSFTVSYWYFSRDISSFKMITKSISNIFRYHLGTVALGSLIITATSLLKFSLWYTKEKLYKSGLANNSLVKCCCSCLSCYVQFFERFLEFLDKRAYVHTALEGFGFCRASKNAFCLIKENSARFLALGAVGDIFKVIGTIFIMAVSTLCGFFIISQNEPYKSRIESPIAPTVMFGIVSYIIAGIFMTFYEMASDAIIQVYLVDEHVHKGSFLAPGTLKSFFEENRTLEHRTTVMSLLANH